MVNIDFFGNEEIYRLNCIQTCRLVTTRFR